MVLVAVRARDAGAAAGTGSADGSGGERKRNRLHPNPYTDVGAVALASFVEVSRRRALNTWALWTAQRIELEVRSNRSQHELSAAANADTELEGKEVPPKIVRRARVAHRAGQA